MAVMSSVVCNSMLTECLVINNIAWLILRGAVAVLLQLFLYAPRGRGTALWRERMALEY